MAKHTLTNKKIHEIVAEVAGPDAIPIVEFLKNRKNVSEFIIADKIKYDMQKTRHLLYKLNDHNIAVYIRRKDRKKGWYISYWTFNRKKIHEVITRLKKEKIDRLREQLNKEMSNRGNFYICGNACLRLDFDEAHESDFKCPECGSLLNQIENERTILNIKEKIRQLQVAS